MTDRPRKEIVSRLRGQAVSIPDLEVMFAHWPGRVNPNQDVVKAAVDYILEHHSMTKAVEMKLKRANLALLIASWYPLASAETLKEITFFVCWMYVVDDAIIDKVSWPGHDNATAFDIAFHELNEFLDRESATRRRYGEEYSSLNNPGNQFLRRYRGGVMSEIHSVAATGILRLLRADDERLSDGAATSHRRAIAVVGRILDVSRGLIVYPNVCGDNRAVDWLQYRRAYHEEQGNARFVDRDYRAHLAYQRPDIS